MHKLIHLFLEETPDQIKRFSAAFAVNDVKEMYSQLHKMKGVCGNIGATTLYEQSKSLENTLKNSTVEQGLHDDYVSHYQTLYQKLSVVVR